METSTKRRAKREYHHGTSPASVVSSVLCLIGFIIMGVGMVFGPNGVGSINWLVLWIGLAVTVGSALVGGILNRVGLGQD